MGLTRRPAALITGGSRGIGAATAIALANAAVMYSLLTAVRPLGRTKSSQSWHNTTCARSLWAATSRSRRTWTGSSLR